MMQTLEEKFSKVKNNMHKYSRVRRNPMTGRRVLINLCFKYLQRRITGLSISFMAFCNRHQAGRKYSSCFTSSTILDQSNYRIM